MKRNRKPSGIADWINFNLLMKSNITTSFLFPHPDLSIGTLKVSMSVCFCVLMGQKCESVHNLKGQLSSPVEKASPYILTGFYFIFWRRRGHRDKTLVSRNQVVFGLLEGPVGGMPEQKFWVPWVLRNLWFWVALQTYSVLHCCSLLSVFLQVCSDFREQRWM